MTTQPTIITQIAEALSYAVTKVCLYIKFLAQCVSYVVYCLFAACVNIAICGATVLAIYYVGDIATRFPEVASAGFKLGFTALLTFVFTSFGPTSRAASETQRQIKKHACTHRHTRIANANQRGRAYRPTSFTDAVHSGMTPYEGNNMDRSTVAAMRQYEASKRTYS